MMNRIVLRFSSFLLGALALPASPLLSQTPPAAPAAPALSPDMQKLQLTLTQMGYQPTVSGGYLRFVDTRNYTFLISLVPNFNPVLLVALPAIPAASLPKLPAVLALQFNDTHVRFFSLQKLDSGACNVYLNYYFPDPKFDASTLMARIAATEADADAARPIWDQTSWK